MNKTDSVSNLVIGVGEVGKAILKILDCEGIDKNEDATDTHYDFLHICINYSDHFVDIVKTYQRQYTPKYTIIHSTVPIGTSLKCDAVHSPIRGVHPELEKGIRTFVKYFGGPNALPCAKLFQEKGLKVKVTEKSNNTEAMKLWDTTQYGILIMLNREIYNFCQKNQLDFDTVYTDANKTYNDGYMELGRPEVVRPWLKHSGFKIGGHCVLPNAKLLKSESAYKLRVYDQSC